MKNPQNRGYFFTFCFIAFLSLITLPSAHAQLTVNYTVDADNDLAIYAGDITGTQLRQIIEKTDVWNNIPLAKVMLPLLPFPLLAKDAGHILAKDARHTRSCE
jgi:hypothetical protein